MTESKRSAFAIPARAALQWWSRGFDFWKQAPLRITLWSLLPLVVEALLQALPDIGVVASKLLTPSVSALVYVAFDGIHRRQPLSAAALAARVRQIGVGALLGLALVMFTIYIAQLIGGYLVYGAPALDVAILGRAEAHRELLDQRFLLMLVLVGLVPGVLLLFVTPLVALGGQSPLRAASISSATMLTSPAAYVVTFVVTAALLAAAITWGRGIALLVLVPWVSAVHFVAYRDVFGQFGRFESPAGNDVVAADGSRDE
ncbi:MAG TPA: hypothetical protein PLW72_06025 [Burkholderiaceae bacterium]|nr:hypothetical protein [Burkholderiaceae bacterium]HQR75617.1 hypothetical protein [Burkholderiaceae bacterium]